MNALNRIKSLLIGNVSRLVTHLRKKSMKNIYIAYGRSDDVLLYRSIINKEIYSSDDVNDLLLCYSDHIMDDYELLDFVSNTKHIYFEMDEALFNADIRNIIILYLLQSTDRNIIEGVFKLFSGKLVSAVECDENFTIYDIYVEYLDILSIGDIRERKDRMISFMKKVNIEYFKDEYINMNVSFEDIDTYIKMEESSGNILSSDDICNIFSNQLSLINKSRYNNSLALKVVDVYKNYSRENITFTLDEFVMHYNDKYGDDFSDFYYGNDFAKLSVALLVFILKTEKNRSADDVYINGFTRFGEYLDKYKSLGNECRSWEEEVSDFVSLKEKDDFLNTEALIQYSYLFEKLKTPIDITFNYFVYLNVSEDLREAFIKAAKWMKRKDKSILVDMTFDGIMQKQNTFDILLQECRDSIFADFSNRKEIHRYYYELVRHVVGYKYISLKDWNSLLNSIVEAYYTKEGLIHIKELLHIISCGGDLVLYQRQNFDSSEFNMMCKMLFKNYPEMREQVSFVSKALNEEIKRVVMEDRILIDAMIYNDHVSLIRDFISGSYFSRMDYLKQTGVSGIRFDKAVAHIREKDSSLYEDFNDKLLSLNRFGSYGIKQK